MDENPEPLVLASKMRARNAHVPLSAELGYGIGDGVVETTIERAELVDGEGGVALDGEASDGLTQVAIVMNNLVDRIPELMESMTVRCRRDAYLRQRSAVTSRRAGDPCAS